MENIIFYGVIGVVLVMFVFDFVVSQLNFNYRKQPLPETVKDVYNETQYKKWLDYSLEKHRLQMISKGTRVVVLVLMLVLGGFNLVDKLASSLTENVHLNSVLFLLIYGLFLHFLSIGFSYYDAFSIEERYGFNKTTKKTFITDEIKSLILSALLTGSIVYILSLLFYSVGDYFYFSALGVIVLFILFINLFYVKLIVPMFNKLTPLEDGELKNQINEFAKKVGFEVSKISIIDASKRSTKLNAYFSGMGKFKQIALYDTLRMKMTDDQIMAVLAHEVGHNKLGHIWSGLAQSIALIAGYLALLLFMIKEPNFMSAFGFDGLHFGFTIILFSMLISPLSRIIGFFTSYISRKHEYQADDYAVKYGYGEEIASALIVLAQENLVNLNPHPLLVKLQYSHPPLSYRLDAIYKKL